MQTYVKLNDGKSIPTLGLGTWKSTPDTVGAAVRYAIEEAGYRHIDCAAIYRNEAEIGEVFKSVFSKKVEREEVFITSKLWNTNHRKELVEKACKQTLFDLHLDYLDLYLMHWGIAFSPGENLEPLDKNGRVIRDNVSIAETWEAMESLVKKGLVKSIGVANFTTIMIIDLLSYAKVKPAMVQIELHPYNTQEELVFFCKEENIAVTAYSPLARQGVARDGKIVNLKLFDEKVIQDIAKKHRKSPAQILLNWGLKRGTIVIPKSVTSDRILENTKIFDFELTNEEMEEIATLNKNYRFVNPSDWWKIPYFQ